MTTMKKNTVEGVCDSVSGVYTVYLAAGVISAPEPSRINCRTSDGRGRFTLERRGAQWWAITPGFSDHRVAGVRLLGST